MASRLMLILAAAIIGSAQPTLAQTEFRGGRWFDGERFVERTVYAIGGRFSFKRPRKVDQIVLLDGGYALPPFGEAHNHNFSGPWDVEKLVRRYLDAGIFYVQNPGNAPLYRDAIPKGALNTPTSVDVTFSNGAITGPRGHPLRLFEEILRPTYYLQRAGQLPYGWFAGKTYHIAGSNGELRTLWPGLLASKPDFIKIILAYSEDYDRNLANPAPAAHRGLDPRLVHEVVRLARARGLRVLAHTETAADFRTAVAAGVDQIAHLPGYNIPSPAEEQRFILREEDAARAARAGISVATTVSISSRIRDPARLELVRRRQAANLRALKAAGVPIVLGSDNVEDTGAAEFDTLASLGVFSNAELLRLWSETTPRSIFPDRRIGRIAPGYEASFIVLARDPMRDLQATDQIVRRFKQGVELGGNSSRAD